MGTFLYFELKKDILLIQTVNILKMIAKTSLFVLISSLREGERIITTIAISTMYKNIFLLICFDRTTVFRPGRRRRK
jgi:hypothetical protein